MIEQKTLLDWTTYHAECLAVMRANTVRWMADGIVKPSDVRIRAGKVMSANPGARKANAG
ncbi:MAG: hypothetical protein NUV75_01835 [Gallionella sp.]|nr:hypothetical protein [Gallionella sp.]